MPPEYWSAVFKPLSPLGLGYLIKLIASSKTSQSTQISHLFLYNTMFYLFVFSHNRNSKKIGQLAHFLIKNKILTNFSMFLSEP